MTRLTFTIFGEPKGKARARAVPKIIYKDGTPRAVVHMVTPNDTRYAEKRVREAFRDKHPRHKAWTGPVMINFTAIFAVPKSFNRELKAAAQRGELYAIKKPDKDNIEKLIIDALNRIAWADDSQVMGGGIKLYGHPPRIDVSIRSLQSAQVPATPGQKRTEARSQGALPLRRPQLARPASHNTDKPAADLSAHSPQARSLIERALEREELSRNNRTRP